MAYFTEWAIMRRIRFHWLASQSLTSRARGFLTRFHCIPSSPWKSFPARHLPSADSIHLNLGYTRSWFQNPNSFDNLHLGQTDPFGNPLPATDQRSQIKTFNISPSWTRLLSNTTVFTLGAFVRRDQYNYYPSADPFADIGPIQQETVAQNRTLANLGLRSDLSYVKGINNVKLGATYQHTFMTEQGNLGSIDPLLNTPCRDVSVKQVSA